MKRSMTVIQEEEFEESAMASNINFNPANASSILSTNRNKVGGFSKEGMALT